MIQIKGGAIHHDSLIGKQYGTRVETSNGKNWVLLLHPTPELWTHTLPHRTQIVYSTDTAMLTLALGLRPGATVVEAGTGSGAVSHALARSVAPDGKLYTFEFHAQRAQLAMEEFEQHGLGGVVISSCRDVCEDGFGLDSIADAVFLDLPMPWKAIESAKSSLKEVGGRLCSFSPCMEQVQRMCQQLRTSGFSDVDVLECVQRPYDVKAHTLSVPAVGVVRQKAVSPSLGSSLLWTAQATNRIPGHTGYLITATLYCIRTST